MDREEYSRRTDGLLDWLAEIGGLIKGALIVGWILVQPFSSYQLSVILAWLLVRVVPSKSSLDNDVRSEKKKKS